MGTQLASQPGDVASAEQGHSCQAHSSLPVDGDQPWLALGQCVGGSGCRQHWVNTLVQAGAGQHSRHCAGRLWAALGLHTHTDWLRLVEEQSSGVGHPSWLLRVQGLQPRGCTQAFCPPLFGVRQAQVVVVLGVFPCRVWCGIPSWLLSAAAAAACSARKVRGLAILLVQQSI